MQKKNFEQLSNWLLVLTNLAYSNDLKWFESEVADIAEFEAVATRNKTFIGINREKHYNNCVLAQFGFKNEVFLFLLINRKRRCESMWIFFHVFASNDINSFLGFLNCFFIY